LWGSIEVSLYQEAGYRNYKYETIIVGSICRQPYRLRRTTSTTGADSQLPV